ncbi:hypothetical protein FA041_23420 [Escherichia coli]|nr:hypothetical protein [Escherichia coli]
MAFSGWALVKRADPGKETEVQNEQPVVEEIVQAQEPAKASEQAVEEQPQAHTEAEAETFAAEVVEVTEQVAESEKRSLKRKSLHSRNWSQKKRRSQWLSNVKSCRCRKTSTPKRFRQKSGGLKRKP